MRALRQVWPWLLIGAVLLAYLNSFAGQFIFDDASLILLNPTIRDLQSLWGMEIMRSSSRPLLVLTFALNHAVGGLDPRGYHAVNVGIHLLAALALFGVVRRTLESPTLRGRYGAHAASLAGMIALLWAVHPLQTASVTYIVQRGESLMGLWYLATLYAVTRGASARSPRPWYLAAVFTCLLGMATKPIMVTAPFLVLLYDRTFLSRTWRDVVRARRWLYLGLTSTLGLVLLLLTRWNESTKSMADAAREIGTAAYAASQPGVLLHYLKLAVWPHPLILDYGWPVARTWQEIALPSMLLAAVLGAIIWAWRRAPGAAFLGTAFFALLAPTSSVIPLSDLAVEYRMYLPLAPIVALVVLGGHGVWRRGRQRTPARLVAIGLMALCAVTLALLTRQRNEQYHDPVRMWRSVVDARPQHARAHLNYAIVLANRGRAADAFQAYVEGNRLGPNTATAHNNFGVVMLRQDQLDGAEVAFQEALRQEPDSAEAHHNLGNVRRRQGRVQEAVQAYAASLRLRPNSAVTLNNLAALYGDLGRLDEAEALLAQAVSIEPEYREARENLARVRHVLRAR